ncbi:glycosyltransferase involved in cell wall biosynthesis [Lewinella aquimaris]|uniref:Glycosyltransferase involved in cell wall biosynthesis n=1 Tax=Neolewinella aquimaris TaxID=1835722 RepID=A0A840E432_9BACT|nr:glycosyltransferase [Neolewinella aquimaris]MBB4079941.1 glycosyltransferase involved in cell wall biosynthesis [Neolewinella aquimaris]
MNIAILAPLEFPLVEPYAGGLEKHTVQLAKGMVGLGHEVTLIARPGSQQIPGLTLVTTLTGYRQALSFLRSQPFDLVHNNTINLVPALFAAWVKCPVVTTLHTPPYRRLVPGALAARLPGGSAFVAISEHLAQQWRRYTGQRCSVIHNGIDCDEWEWSGSAQANTAIWYGRLTPEKGAEFAIEACREAGYRLQLAGPISDPTYFSRIITPLLGEDARYLGHLSQREIAQLTARSAVGLFTSVWEEPFGLVLLEMLACGTPVAGFSSGAVPEIVTPAISKLVPTGNTVALAGAITEAATLKRSTCRSYVEANFPVSRMIAAYNQLYHQLTAG